ncbi:MAG TPA: DinB family protein [Ilumatobacteraceae bacterium]|nr:DinB family protein [Ilumatobacteraceae bacterium]
MSQPITPLPAAKAVAEDERSVLLGYLAYHRAVLARKVEGLRDEQARLSTCPPSTLNLLGLIRHMTDVERWWFRRVLLAEDVPALFDDDEEWQVPVEATIAEAIAAYWSEIETIDRHLLTASMDDRNLGEPQVGQHTLRRTIVHMIEEYARHCGHADLIREAIDGATGD